MQPPEQGKLTDVGHNIGQRTLEKLVFGNAEQLRITVQIPPKILEDIMESVYLCLYGGERFRVILAADETRSSIPQDACHMTEDCLRRPHFVPG